jgi:hypothetical protein
MNYPGYANLESVDATNWPLWLLAFLLALGASLIVGFLYYKLHESEFIQSVKKPRRLPTVSKGNFKS